MCLRGMKSSVHTHSGTRMLVLALLVMASKWKQPECPPGGKWINKLWRVFTMEYDAAKKRNRNIDLCNNMDPFQNIYVKWRKLDKTRVHITFLLNKIHENENQCLPTENRSVVVWGAWVGWEWGNERVGLQKGWGKLWWVRVMFIILIKVVVSQGHPCVKTHLFSHLKSIQFIISQQSCLKNCSYSTLSFVVFPLKKKCSGAPVWLSP